MPGNRNLRIRWQNYYMLDLRADPQAAAHTSAQMWWVCLQPPFPSSDAQNWEFWANMEPRSSALPPRRCPEQAASFGICGVGGSGFSFFKSIPKEHALQTGGRRVSRMTVEGCPTKKESKRTTDPVTELQNMRIRTRACFFVFCLPGRVSSSLCTKI